MTYQKHYNIDVGIQYRSGLILADIMVAISLGALFVITITQTFQSSREVFEYAHERNRLMNVYEVHENAFRDMKLYESRTTTLNSDDVGYQRYSTTTIEAYAHWYGNDRIQTDMHVFSDTGSIHFVNIRSNPFTMSDEVAGTALCSVDFTSGSIVGSFGYGQATKPDPQILVPHITPITLPLDPSIPLTHIEVRSGIAYISTDSSRQSDPDVLIFDMHDATHPLLLSGIHTGPGISEISVVGNRIFSAVTSRTAQLQSIHLQDLNTMSIESSYKLPLPYASATPPLGSSLFYDRGFVYLGTDKWDGDEFSVIQVSNPAMPLKISGIEIGSKVHAIYVRDGFAYVAASDQKQLHIIDVHDPSRPFLVDFFSPSGWERQEGKSLSFFEGELQFGRTSGGFNIKQDRELFALSSSTLPYVQHSNDYSADLAGGVYGIISDRSFLYAISRQGGQEFQIYDRTLATTTVTYIQLPSVPQSLSCDSDSLYVLSASSPVVYHIQF